MLAESFSVIVALSKRLPLIRTCIGGILLDLLSLEPESIALVFEIEVDQRRWVPLMQRRVLRMLVGKSVSHCISCQAMFVGCWIISRLSPVVNAAFRLCIAVLLLPTAVLKCASVVVRRVRRLFVLKRTVSSTLMVLHL